MLIFLAGAGGVRIGAGIHGLPSPGDVAVGVVVEDTVIEDGGHVHREGCGVLMQAAQNCTVTHNSIGNLYYTGVSMGWTWNYVATGECSAVRCAESRKGGEGGSTTNVSLHSL